MTLDEARKIIRDSHTAFPRHVEAAAVIADSRRSEISDLIRCLHLGGLPAETAATALYTRMGRPYSGQIAEFSTDPIEWSNYLASQLEAASR